jgi:2-iminobutanoate/2-iminopropanoate deaminase
MPREIVSTEHAPKAIGPYSQAVIASTATAAGSGSGAAAARWIFCSGQIPLDPTTGEMVGAGDVRIQATRVLQNLQAVLTAAGTSLEAVVKTTIYLTDLQDFGAVNEVYARYFPAHPPARATVQVAGLPRGAMVEIDAIAIADAGGG